MNKIKLSGIFKGLAILLCIYGVMNGVQSLLFVILAILMYWK